MYGTNSLPLAGTTWQAAKRYFAFVTRTAILLLLSSACFADPPSVAPAAKPFLVLPVESTSRSDDPLAHDPRLKVRVTYKRRATTMGETLRTLSAQTGVKLVADGVELGLTDLSCAYEDVSLRDVLDSLSRVRNFVWKRRKDNALLLRDGYHEHQFDAHRPHTKAEAEMWRQGKKFLDAYKNLPENMRKDMTSISGAPSANPDGYGTPISDLPPAARQAVNAMFQAYLPEFSDAHPELDLKSRANPNNTSGLKVTISSNKQEGFQAFSIGVGQSGNGSAAGFSLDMPFMVFDDPRDNAERIVPKDAIPSGQWRGDKEDNQSRRGQSMENALLNKKVTLARHRYSLYEALQEMKAQTGVDFATQLLPSNNAARPFFACADMPLKNALEALCKARNYSDAYTSWTWTWGIRKSGIVLLHCTPDYLALNAPGAQTQTTRK